MIAPNTTGEIIPEPHFHTTKDLYDNPIARILALRPRSRRTIAAMREQENGRGDQPNARAASTPIPGNVVRAINYCHSPGWGAPVTADASYRDKLSNVKFGGDLGISRMAMDKSPKIQAEIERAILPVSQTR
jgi:hypothetical protein